MTPPEPDYSSNFNLTPQQHHVINILADGGTITGAAAAIGIHRNTIRNWRRSVPEFAIELDFAIRDQALCWHEHAVILAPKAIEVLSTILHNEAASPSLRVRVATTILKMATEPKTPMHKHAQPAQSALDALPGELFAIQHNLAQRQADQSAPATVRKSPEPAATRNAPAIPA